MASQERPAFDDIFMELAQNLARRSHCIKAQVGAVLTKDTRIISIGYNGPPSGTHNCDEEFPETGCPRDSKGSCSLALHAEQNAILYAVKNGANLEGTTLYVTLSPCIACHENKTGHFFGLVCGLQRHWYRRRRGVFAQIWGTSRTPPLGGYRTIK